MDASTFAITAEMVQPLVSTVTSTVITLIPVGVGILGVMWGTRLVPKVLGRFFK